MHLGNKIALLGQGLRTCRRGDVRRKEGRLFSPDLRGIIGGTPHTSCQNDFYPTAINNRMVIRQLSISPELLIEILRDPESLKIVQQGIPEDAKIVDCEWDVLRTCVVLHITSASFKPEDDEMEIVVKYTAKT